MQEENFLKIIKNICEVEQLSFDNMEENLILFEQSSSKGIFGTESWSKSDINDFVYKVFNTDIFTTTQSVQLFYIYSNLLSFQSVNVENPTPLNLNHCLLQIIDAKLKDMSYELLKEPLLVQNHCGRLEDIHIHKIKYGITNAQLLNLFQLIFRNHFKYFPSISEIIPIIQEFYLEILTTTYEYEKMPSCLNFSTNYTNEYTYISLSLDSIEKKVNKYLEFYITLEPLKTNEPLKTKKPIRIEKKVIKNEEENQMDTTIRNVALNYNGQLVIKRKDGSYVRYNIETKQLENFQTYVIENNKYIFIFPTNQLNINDVFMNDNEEFFHVLNVSETNIDTINLNTGAFQTMIKETTYNMELYKKVVTVFDCNNINPMMFLLMKDKELDPLMLMMLNNNNETNFNPLMFLAMQDKEIDPMMLMMMNNAKNNTQFNPLMLMLLKNNEKLDKDMLMALALSNNGMNNFAPVTFNS